MGQRRLPTKLGKEPLVDAVLELRLESAAPASQIIPGALFTALNTSDDPIEVGRTPVSQVPEPVRRSDENLRYAALVTLKWKGFTIHISDLSLAVSCNLPYPGWAKFKQAIVQVVKTIFDMGLIKKVDRLSMKYVSLIEATDLKQQASLFDWDLRLGEHKVSEDVAGIRVEIPRGDFVNLVSIQTGAIIKLVTGSQRSGSLVEVDTIGRNVLPVPSQFVSTLDRQLEELHTVNKTTFFSCLRESTIQSLEPIYD